MTQVLLTLKPEIKVIEVDEKQATLQFPLFEFPLYWSAGGREVLRRLAETGITDEQIKATVTQHDGVGGLFKFSAQFSRLVNMGIICQTLEADGQALATLLPIGSSHRGHSGAVDPDQRYTLSRFAFLRKEDGQLVLECPVGAARLLLFQPQLAALIALLAAPHSIHAVCANLPLWSEETIQRFFKMLLSARALSEVDEAGNPTEDQHPALAVWDFHDLLFHTRSRIGRYDKLYTGEFRFIDKLPLPPVVKPPMSETIIPLYTPDLSHLREHDIPLAEVMETRQSVYDYGETPITAAQVGEFLYRVARVKKTFQEELTNRDGLSETVEYSQRPYPAGGALYELEIYLTIHACDGLAPGLYHYDPARHQLESLKELNAQLTALLTDAERAMMHGQKPNILITLAARYQRIAWKYNTLAYALIQKNVGVLYQTMYLTATAMGLAPCAIGAGNADLFAEATGLDYLVEGSVGDFALSSKKS